MPISLKQASEVLLHLVSRSCDSCQRRAQPKPGVSSAATSNAEEGLAGDERVEPEGVGLSEGLEEACS